MFWHLTTSNTFDSTQVCLDRKVKLKQVLGRCKQSSCYNPFIFVNFWKYWANYALLSKAFPTLLLGGSTACSTGHWPQLRCLASIPFPAVVRKWMCHFISACPFHPSVPLVCLECMFFWAGVFSLWRGVYILCKIMEWQFCQDLWGLL